MKRRRKREGEQKGRGGGGTPSKVSRLVTSVTEYRLAEKRKRIAWSDVRSSRKSLCLSVFLLVVIANRARRRVCKKKNSIGSAFGYVVLQTEKKKKIAGKTVAIASVGDHPYRNHRLF